MGHEYIAENTNKFIDNLKAGEHICSFYQTDEENELILASFIKRGLRKNEKVICLTDEVRVKGINAALLKQDVNSEDFLFKKQLDFLRSTDVYCRNDFFDPDIMISFLEKTANKAIEEGYDCVSFAGDMIWALKKYPGSEKLLEYESKVNDFFSTHKALVLCQYDYKKFDPSVLIEILNVHPNVIFGTEVYDNVSYIPTKEFLNGRSNAKLQYQLKNLKERKILNGTLKQSEYRYRGLFETAANLIISLDGEGIINECNYQSFKYLGYTSEELIGLPIDSLIHADDAPKAKIAFKEISDIGYSFDKDYRMIKKSGEEVNVIINSSKIKGDVGRTDQIICIIVDVTEQKKIEKSLREKEERWRQLFDNMSNGVAIYKAINNGEEFILESLNKFGLSHIKLEIQDVVGKNVSEIFPGIVKLGMIDFLKRVYKTGVAEYFPASLYKDDELFFWVENYIFKLPSGNLVTIYHDKTEQYLWEKALVESEEKLKIIANNYPKGSINLIDREYKFLFASGKDYDQFGVDPNDLIGKTIQEILPRKSQKILLKNLEHAFQEEISSNCEIEINDNFYENTIVPIKGGINKNIERVLLISNNITERKKIEINLVKSEEKYRHLVNNINDLVTVVDQEGEFVYVSPKHEKILGYTPEELMKKKVFDIIHPKDLTNALRKNVELQKKVGTSNDIWRFKNKAGRYVILECKSAVYKDNDGKKVTVVISRDITKLKKDEIALKKAKEKAEESDRLKSAFLANMSHEIRTPMNGIVGFAKMIDRKDISEDKRKYFIKIINESCNQLLNIVNDILDISKIETRQMKIVEKETDLNNLMLEIFSFYQPKASINNLQLYLKKGLGQEKCLIWLDGIKLRQILCNLISNALKFTNKGYIQFGYQLENGNLRFYVKDTGIGIGKKYHQIIFERFGQAKKMEDKELRGTGLGLSISKGFVELMGGKIWVDSKLGEGSVFYFTIPYKPVINKIKETSFAKTDKEKIVLIVEDEEINYILIEEALQEYNIKYFHVKNGQEAIDFCKLNDEVDLVLMDLKIPIINGFDATKEIKKLRPDIPIIAQTALALSEDKEKAYAYGCDDYIAKPIEIDELLCKVTKFLKI